MITFTLPCNQCGHAETVSPSSSAPLASAPPHPLDGASDRDGAGPLDRSDAVNLAIDAAIDGSAT